MKLVGDDDYWYKDKDYLKEILSNTMVLYRALENNKDKSPDSSPTNWEVVGDVDYDFESEWL